MGTAAYVAKYVAKGGWLQRREEHRADFVGDVGDDSLASLCIAYVEGQHQVELGRRINVRDRHLNTLDEGEGGEWKEGKCSPYFGALNGLDKRAKTQSGEGWKEAISARATNVWERATARGTAQRPKAAQRIMCACCAGAADTSPATTRSRHHHGRRARTKGESKGGTA